MRKQNIHTGVMCGRLGAIASCGREADRPEVLPLRRVSRGTMADETIDWQARHPDFDRLVRVAETLTIVQYDSPAREISRQVDRHIGRFQHYAMIHGTRVNLITPRVFAKWAIKQYTAIKGAHMVRVLDAVFRGNPINVASVLNGRPDTLAPGRRLIHAAVNGHFSQIPDQVTLGERIALLLAKFGEHRSGGVCSVVDEKIHRRFSERYQTTKESNA